MNRQLKQTACRYGFGPEIPPRDLAGTEVPTFGCMTVSPGTASENTVPRRYRSDDLAPLFYLDQVSIQNPSTCGCKRASRQTGALLRECLSLSLVYPAQVDSRFPMAARCDAAPFLCRLKPSSFLERFS